jgi:hypothetical protein
MAQTGRNLLSQEPPKGKNLFSEEVPVPSQPTTEPENRPDQRFDIGKIPEATAYGGLFGAFTPEIMKGAAKVSQFSPYTRAFSPMLEVASEAARGRRTAGAVGGAFSAGTGETAVQTAKAMGAGPVTQEALRFGTEILAPAGLVAAGRSLPITREFIQDITEGGYKEATQRFADRLRGPAAREARAAQEAVIGGLEREASALRAQGKQQADQIIASAEAEAARLAPTNAQQAAQIRQAARDRANNILGDIERRVAFKRAALSRTRGVIAEAERIPGGTRALIGEPKEATDVGSALRDRITEVQKDRLAAREAQVEADKATVVADVQAKQSAKNFVADQPEYKDLMIELQKKLGIGDIGKKFPLEAETDQNVKSALRSLYDALNPKSEARQYQDASGTAVQMPIGFDAIDTIRRRLGEAYRNPTAEGYGAIGQGYARDYYKKLSEILGKYSEPKKDLIANYETLSRDLDVFKTGAGQKATAVERFDPDRFKTYASELPANYFANRESVRDLVELTGGDKRFVEQQAASYVARQLENVKTAQAASNWEAANRDWLVEFPALQGSVNRYLESLGFAERRIPRTEAVAKALKTEIPKIPELAKKEAAGVVKEAEKQATALERPGAAAMAGARGQARTAEAAASAKAKLLSSLGKDPVKAFDELVRAGNTDRLRAAAPVIKGDPELQNQFLEGVRISISRLDPKNMADDYRRLIQPALLDTELIDAKQAKQIADQVRLVEMSVAPERRAMAITSAIRNAVTGTGGAATSRLMESLGLSFTQPFLGGQ